MTTSTQTRLLVIAGVAVVQLVLAALAVAPQLSARASGETYLMRVAIIDPIDPFRGAYVDLDYPDLQPADSPEEDQWESGTDSVPGEGDRIFVELKEEQGVMVTTGWTRERPDEGPYLACKDLDWEISCGIESWFLPQDQAAEMEDLLMDSGAVAELRVDRWGNAALVDVREP